MQTSSRSPSTAAAPTSTTPSASSRPFAEDTTTLLRILNAQQPTVRRLVADTGTVFDALSERDGQLRGLIENRNRVFATTAARNRELADTFRVAADVRARVDADGQPPRALRARRRTRS